jgi:hypothetical protein
MQERFNRREAARYLTEESKVKTAASTLQKLATLGGGPKYRIVAGMADYQRQHLDEYADSKFGPVVSSTSELPPRQRKCEPTLDSPATESAEA